MLIVIRAAPPVIDGGTGARGREPASATRAPTPSMPCGRLRVRSRRRQIGSRHLSAHSKSRCSCQAGEAWRSTFAFARLHWTLQRSPQCLVSSLQTRTKPSVRCMRREHIGQLLCGLHTRHVHVCYLASRLRYHIYFTSFTVRLCRELPPSSPSFEE